MGPERDDARIGFLVFLALALFLGFFFKRSLTAAFRREVPFQVGLDRVSDVDEGTEVQLQGLRVGQVEAVELVQEGVDIRFRVRVGLRPGIQLWQGTRVQVVSKPLGGSYLDLQLPPPDRRSAALAPGSLLPGTPGASLAGLVEGASTLVADLDGAVRDLRGRFQAQGAGALLDNPRLASLLDHLQETLDAFGKLARDSQSLVGHGERSMTALDRNLDSLEHNLEEVRKLVGGRSGEVDELMARLGGTLKELEGLGRELNGLVKRGGPSGEAALQALERNLKSTEELLEILKAKPSRALWGRPGKAEREEAARRAEAARKAAASGTPKP